MAQAESLLHSGTYFKSTFQHTLEIVLQNKTLNNVFYYIGMYPKLAKA